MTKVEILLNLTTELLEIFDTYTSISHRDILLKTWCGKVRKLVGIEEALMFHRIIDNMKVN